MQFKTNQKVLSNISFNRWLVVSYGWYGTYPIQKYVKAYFQDHPLHLTQSKLVDCRSVHENETNE